MTLVAAPDDCKDVKCDGLEDCTAVCAGYYEIKDDRLRPCEPKDTLNKCDKSAVKIDYCAPSPPPPPISPCGTVFLTIEIAAAYQAMLKPAPHGYW